MEITFPLSPAEQRRLTQHVTYNFQMHAIKIIRRIGGVSWKSGYHDTVVDTVCGVSVCYQRREEKSVLFDPAVKPLSCIICISET